MENKDALKGYENMVNRLEKRTAKLDVEGKNDVSNKALKRLKGVMYDQDDFGIEKYRQPLKSTYNYDWLQMFLEEIADGLKYIENEIERRQMVKNFLEMGLKSENPKKFIQMALDQLNKTGTGK
jgi:hypothetical protein